MKTFLFNQKGEKEKEIELPDKIFNVPVNSDLLHQTVLYYENLSRQPIAKTKDRGEVKGGGRKPWRQKGTGRARHGSIRSPLWRGGGVTFGPTPEKKYQIKIPKKVRRKALFMILSQKFKDKEIIFLNKIKISEPKTKRFVELLKSLNRIKKDMDRKSIIFILSRKDDNLLKAARNVKRVSLVSVKSLNPYILLKNRYVIFEEEAVKQLTTSLGEQKE